MEAKGINNYAELPMTKERGFLVQPLWYNSKKSQIMEKQNLKLKVMNIDSENDGLASLYRVRTKTLIK